MGWPIDGVIGALADTKRCSSVRGFTGEQMGRRRRRERLRGRRQVVGRRGQAKQGITLAVEMLKDTPSAQVMPVGAAWGLGNEQPQQQLSTAAPHLTQVISSSPRTITEPLYSQALHPCIGP